MNDFTKDELETLLHALKHTNIHDWEVGKKIQSMIDNYCDHEYRVCGTAHSMYARCFKCGDSAPVVRL